ncbi:MAG: hypothetical protein AAF911_08130 [Planctomycetota bacterium]
MTPATSEAQLAPTPAQRIQALIGRLRARQLELAQRGKTTDSARYAERAHRVRQALAVLA